MDNAYLLEWDDNCPHQKYFEKHEPIVALALRYNGHGFLEVVQLVALRCIHSSKQHYGKLN